jgi:hypothetical protein
MPLEFKRLKDYFMSDETAIGSAGTADGGRHSQRGRGQSTPLQSRAKFLENWNWLSVTQINVGLCERGRAQRGINKETHAAVAEEWEKYQTSELTLLETFQFLKSCHRRAPFLFLTATPLRKLGVPWPMPCCQIFPSIAVRKHPPHRSLHYRSAG